MYHHNLDLGLIKTKVYKSQVWKDPISVMYFSWDHIRHLFVPIDVFIRQ